MDQLGLATFTSPAIGAGSGVQWDVTAGGITEDVKAAILLYSASVSDDTPITHGRVGLTFFDAESSSKRNSLCTLARDGLSTPDCRGTTGLAMRVPRSSAFGTQYDLANEYVSQIAGGLRFETTIDPLVQTKGVALLFAGANMRAFGLTLEATTTLQNADTGAVLPSDVRFQPDLLAVFAKDGGVGGVQSNDAMMCVGFVKRGTGTPQVSFFCDWADATEPSEADGEVVSDAGVAGLSSASRATRIKVTFGFTSTGITYQASANDLSIYVLAIKFENANQRFEVAQLEVEGTSPQGFPLSFDPKYVVGLASLIDAQDTPDGTAQAGTFGLFAFSPTLERAYSARFKTGESTTSAASSRQGDHAVLVLDDQGSVAMQGSYSGTASPHGFQLTFSPASTGFLTLLALAEPGLLDPPAVPLALVVPAVTIGGLITPPAKTLPLVVPAPFVLLPKQPPAVALTLSMPAPQLFQAPLLPARVIPELGPLYAQALSSLLPRGLAWPRRPSS